MKLNPNMKAYMALLLHRAYSRDNESQDRFLDMMKDKFVKRGFVCYTDTYGNLLAERKKHQEFVPLVIAHVDIAQPITFPTPIESEGWIIGMLNGVQKGLGHDDRAGVYFAQQIAETDIECKIILTKDEEVGAIGAGKLPKEFFSDVSLCLQLDRRGASDISDHTNGVEVVSTEFKTKVKGLLKKHNYAFTTCMFTDVGELKSHLEVDMCCMNISCGYYDEHSHQERLYWPQYVNACNFAFGILNLCGREKQVHKAVVYRRTYDTYTGKKSNAPTWWDYDPITKSVVFLGGEEEDETLPLLPLPKSCQHCGGPNATWNTYWQSHVCDPCLNEVGQL